MNFLRRNVLGNTYLLHAFPRNIDREEKETARQLQIQMKELRIREEEVSCERDSSFCRMQTGGSKTQEGISCLGGHVETGTRETGK